MANLGHSLEPYSNNYKPAIQSQSSMKMVQFLTFHAKHERGQAQGVCWGQCCKIYGPISLLGQRHHSVPTISHATRRLLRSSPTCPHFSQNVGLHNPAKKHNTPDFKHIDL